MRYGNIEDSLIIAIDFSDYDEDILTVARRRKDDKYNIINIFKNNEAIELYNKLIGKR